MAVKVEKVLYTANTHTTGGREGRSVSSDGLLDILLDKPKEMGGKAGATNPEQLFAAGYSACFIGALKHVASVKKIAWPEETAVDASVDLGPTASGSFGLAVRMSVSLPGLDQEVAQGLLDSAHKMCPYSNATRGNIDVAITLA
jgi:lipoyl-dependent peroxiredoxin